MSHRHFYRSLTRNVDFRGRGLFEPIDDFSKCIVQVTTDNTWLSATPNQVFEDFYVKLVSKAKDVEFTVNIIQHMFEVFRGTCCFIMVWILAIGKKNH